MTRCVAKRIVLDCAPLHGVSDPDTLESLTLDLASGQAQRGCDGGVRHAG